MRVGVELRAAAMDLPSSSEKAVPYCAVCFRLLHNTCCSRLADSQHISSARNFSTILEFDAALVQYNRETLSHRLPITERHASST